MIFAKFDFEEVEDNVDDLYYTDVLILSSMVLEGAIFPLVLVKVELVVAYNKASQEKVKEQSARHHQMEVFESDIRWLDQLFAIIFL